MAIDQAMAVPKGRLVGVAYLSAFVEEMKASGFLAATLARHKIEGRQLEHWPVRWVARRVEASAMPIRCRG